VGMSFFRETIIAGVGEIASDASFTRFWTCLATSEWRMMEDDGVPVGRDYSELGRERIGIFQGNDYRGGWGGLGRLVNG
jgi:hypothetical protein